LLEELNPFELRERDDQKSFLENDGQSFIEIEHLLICVFICLANQDGASHFNQSECFISA